MYVSFHVNQKVHAACNFQRIIGSRRLLAVTGSIITNNNNYITYYISHNISEMVQDTDFMTTHTHTTV